MIQREGDVFQVYPFPPRRKGSIYDWHRMILFPANGHLVRGQGGRRLVMGAGAAKQVKEMFSHIDRELAQAIRQVGEEIEGRRGVYKFGVAAYTSGIGAFQSKLSWRDKSSLELIEFSVGKLQNRLNKNPELLVELIYPGIGLGGLRESDVSPLLEVLPDSVTAWKL